jgi:hypothetical protein
MLAVRAIDARESIEKGIGTNTSLPGALQIRSKAPAF